MNSISVLEWNINQRGGNGKGNIPHWIKDEINGYDVVVLTEFCTRCGGQTAFIADIEQMGYHCAASENIGGNDILIAVKSDFPIVKVMWEPCYDANTIPENLRVDIDCGGGLLTVIGIRIKTLGDFKMRKQEFKWILDQIGEIKQPILMAGDFNHGKLGLDDQDWSMSIMKAMLDSRAFTLYTPEGSSIYGVENYNGNEFPNDHFAARGAEIILEPYDRKFTSRDPLAYFLGRDFQEMWYPGANYNDLLTIKPPFPDHAILKGTLHIPTQKE